MFHDDTIAGSWTGLNDRLKCEATLLRWGTVEPALAGLTSVAELAAAVAMGADPDHADAVIGALVRLAAADGEGDQDALLLLLHLLSDWVIPLATQLRDLGPEMVGVVVGELTCQILAYPWRSRSCAHAYGLKLDTRHAVLSEFRPSTPRRRHRAECVLAPMTTDWEMLPLGQGITPPGDDQDVDLDDLLVWAARHGVGLDDIALLVRTERARADSSVKASDDVVAAEQGVALRTLYRRRARTLSELRVAARDYLAAVA